MSLAKSVVTELLEAFPDWRPQMYFKSSLTALSHAMEDLVLAGDENPLIIATFQKERFYLQETQRYQKIAQKSNQVYVLASPESEFTNYSGVYEMVAFDSTDVLTQEWHLVVIGSTFASCLICREKTGLIDSPKTLLGNSDSNRRFEGIWTSERKLSQAVARILLDRIQIYRPELKEKIDRARAKYLEPSKKIHSLARRESFQANPDPFVDRLIAYLQAAQYKLIKANTSLGIKEEKERLINSVTSAIRRSLNPDEILRVAVSKLGQGIDVCRSLIYRCTEEDKEVLIQYEFLKHNVISLQNKNWPLQNNPLFKEIIQNREPLFIIDATKDSRVVSLKEIVKNCSIVSWLLVPVVYQGRLLGMIELHHCDPSTICWKQEDIDLVDTIAVQVGVALIQAEAYANLQYLNKQLEALDRTRSNLVAITGHELRTPLSTIQVCLESLASEPDMDLDLRQVMLNTALEDAERMRKLIQDFLTLSQLESGRIKWHPEPVSLMECTELALSHLNARNRNGNIPKIENLLPLDLPMIQADGEWLVEVLFKLLDNACKFTPSASGKIVLRVSQEKINFLKMSVSDNGRGIEASLLETVFDRFYQEEGALRRSIGGTGLGLAICRQIVNGWGGEIWAESEGKNKGSNFQFTIPLFFDL
jgi:DICT domain-containing protein/signal transduction histidine kinase